MKTGIVAIGIVVSAMVAVSGGARAAAMPSRPKIEGISHLAVYSTDLAAADHFYGTILGGRKVPDPDDRGAVRYLFSGVQSVEIIPARAGHGPGMLAHVAYRTANASALRAFLAARRQPALGPLRRGRDGNRWFATQDPEGNEIRFVQATGSDVPEAGAISGRIIHVGYMVRDRAREDGFYRGLLGFRPYWHGAMRDDATDWVSQQVPDGWDWLEYMLVGPGSTTPLSRLDARELGVLDHVSLGVPDMKAAVARLTAENRLSPRHDGPQLGKDGKWQANLYDPDGTRVELMEFKPVAPPCCSPFTAPGPER